MKKLISTALLFGFMSLSANATVWIMIGDPAENKIGAIGMSSGNIGDKTFAMADNAGIISIGAWYVSKAQKRLSPLLYRSISTQNMIEEISREANRKVYRNGKYTRRVTLIRSNFETASLAGKGCHNANYYCGEVVGQNYVITGGGLTSPEVISETVKVIEANAKMNMPLECQLAKAMRKLADMGGEWKLFERIMIGVDDLSLRRDAYSKYFKRKGRHENDLHADLNSYLKKKHIYCN